MKRVKLLYSEDLRSGITPIPPKKFRGKYSEVNKVEGKAYISYSWKDKRKLMDKGYIVQPSDCPPIRNINKYGHLVYAAGTSKIEKHEEPRKRKTHTDGSTFGLYTHSGDACGFTDSQFLSSWLANSEYIKIVTGLVVFCPVGFGLYQGQVPYMNNSDFEVLSAIEYGNSMGNYEIEGEAYFMVEVNAVIRPLKRNIIISKNDPLAIIYPVLKTTDFQFDSIDTKRAKEIFDV